VQVQVIWFLTLTGYLSRQVCHRFEFFDHYYPLAVEGLPEKNETVMLNEVKHPIRGEGR